MEYEFVIKGRVDVDDYTVDEETLGDAISDALDATDFDCDVEDDEDDVSVEFMINIYSVDVKQHVDNA